MKEPAIKFGELRIYSESATARPSAGRLREEMKNNKSPPDQTARTFSRSCAPTVFQGRASVSIRRHPIDHSRPCVRYALYLEGGSILPHSRIEGGANGKIQEPDGFWITSRIGTSKFSNKSALLRLVIGDSARQELPLLKLRPSLSAHAWKIHILLCMERPEYIFEQN